MIASHQHTPGPWRIQTTIYSKQPLIVNEHGAFVADTDAHNAYLIAAAPDMLAALERIEQQLDYGQTAAALAIARAAIAKATGD
jgi:hypothetical protein